MSRIAVFGSGLGGAKSTFVTAKHVKNAYCELRPQGEKSSVVAYGRFGRDLFLNVGAAPLRGGWWITRGILGYIVSGAALYSFNNAGVTTQIGTLNTTSGRVSMTDNGTQLMIVDGTNGYIYSTVSTAGLTPQSISSITIDATGTIGTMTTGSAHGLAVGNIIVIAGATPTQWNGSYTVASVTSPTVFTFNTDNAPAGSASPVGTYTIVSFAQITSLQFPPNAQTCTFCAGVFVVQSSGTGTFYASGIYNGLAGYSLNFATAEDAPDPMMAVWESNGQLFLLCANHTEFWGVSGGLNFLFSEVQGTTSEWGLAATFGVARFGNTVACLMRNRTSQVMIAEIAGYLPQPLSNPDMDTILNSYANVADAEFYSFMLGGHPMLFCNFPSAGASWMYDHQTKFWHPMSGAASPADISLFGFSFLNNIMVTDVSNGNLYKLNPSGLTDNGAAINIEIIGETLADPDLGRITVNRLRCDFRVGQGLSSGQGSNPQVGLQVSRDNGNTYGAQMNRTLGLQGDYTQTVEWDCLGEARNFVFKWTMSDPVPFAMVSANVNPDD